MCSDFNMLSVKRTTFFGSLLDNVAIRCSYFFKSVPCLLKQIFIIAVSITVEIECSWLANMFLLDLVLLQFHDIYFLVTFVLLCHSFLFIKAKFVISTSYIVEILWYLRRHYLLGTMFHSGFRNLYQLSIFHYLWLQIFC